MYKGNQISYDNLNEKLKKKISKADFEIVNDLTTGGIDKVLSAEQGKKLDNIVNEHVAEIKPKVDNSWQKGLYNDTDIMNLGLAHAKRTFLVRPEDWKASALNIEMMSIVLPIINFSGIIKVTYAGSWTYTNTEGGAEIIYNYAKASSTLRTHSKTITSISPLFAENYLIRDLNYNESVVTIPIVRVPHARNYLTITVELYMSQYTAMNNLKDATLVFEDLGTTWISYPWTPQTPTYLAANTYNPSSSIMNLSDKRATRVFPQVNWKASAGTPELWESILVMTKPVWGILELDIAGYSAAAGGAKIIVELGINLPSDTASPSTEFRRKLKVVTASTGFTDNFFVEVEHRASARYLLIKVYKRNYNDPITISATFTSTVSPQTAFEFLRGFTDGAYYTNIAGVDPTLQKDFDTRISENFTLLSSFLNRK